MARLGIISTPPPITTGTVKTTMQQWVAATNQVVAIREIALSFNGVSNTSTPILCEAVRQTSTGTLTNTTTFRKTNPDQTETVQTTGKDTATLEPTDAGDVPWQEYIHPQTGDTWQAGGWLTDELLIPGAGRLGVRVTAGTSVSCAVRIRGEE